MKNLFKDWNWEDTTASVFILIVLLTVSILTTAIIADHRVTHYSLSGTYEGSLLIIANRNWCPNEEIKLGKAMSYEDAVKMLNDLNTNLLYDGD